jgi:hypothetical protein
MHRFGREGHLGVLGLAVAMVFCASGGCEEIPALLAGAAAEGTAETAEAVVAETLSESIAETAASDLVGEMVLSESVAWTPVASGASSAVATGTIASTTDLLKFTYYAAQVCGAVLDLREKHLKLSLAHDGGDKTSEVVATLSDEQLRTLLASREIEVVLQGGEHVKLQVAIRGAEVPVHTQPVPNYPTVTEVIAGSAAERAGMRMGDRITMLMASDHVVVVSGAHDQATLKEMARHHISVSDLKDAVRAARGRITAISVNRDGREVYIPVSMTPSEPLGVWYKMAP